MLTLEFFNTNYSWQRQWVMLTSSVFWMVITVGF